MHVVGIAVARSSPNRTVACCARAEHRVIATRPVRAGQRGRRRSKRCRHVAKPNAASVSSV
eukprot:5234647-Prymnesium_polylepis.1